MQVDKEIFSYKPFCARYMKAYISQIMAFNINNLEFHQVWNHGIATTVLHSAHIYTTCKKVNFINSLPYLFYPSLFRIEYITAHLVIYNIRFCECKFFMLYEYSNGIIMKINKLIFFSKQKMFSSHYILVIQ